MASPAGAFHTAQEAALRASVALATAMGGQVRLYTEVPDNAPLPYIVIGSDQVILDASSDCADEAEIVSTVQWWTRKSPLDHGAQARAMGSAIITALNIAMTVTGWDVIEFLCQSEEYNTDPDRSTRGRAVFEYQLTEQVA